MVAAIANELPENSFWKPILIVASPLITISASGLWLFIKVVYVDPFVNSRKHKAANAAMEQILAEARANAARVMGNPHASDEHKREVNKVVEDLEKLRLKKITERMQVVAAD